MPSISGKLLLVIGGSSGIGFAVAQQALTEGVRVAIASSNIERVNDAVARLKAIHSTGDVTGYVCDFREADLETHLEAVLYQITAAHSNELFDHIVITAADLSGTKNLTDITSETVLHAAQMRLVGPVIVAKLATRFLKNTYISSLTFTAGTVAIRPFSDWPLMSGFAAGLEGLTLGLALDMAPLRVNIVLPGATLTELWGPDREERAKQIAKTAHLGRVGMPEEVAEAYIYAMKNSNLTGSSLHSDGGAHLK
jgi:NAD(P)-dependent dehydrogenase (short-subunit alcohol dehydrogenase family)